MVASREVDIPLYRGFGRQRRRGFVAFAKGIARNAIPFLRKFIVPAAKRVGAALLEFALPEIEEFVSGRKTFKTVAESVERQTLRKYLGSGSRKRKGAIGGQQASRVLPAKSAQQISRWRRDILTNIFQ